MKHSIGLAAVLFGLGGCAGLMDPYQREGTWHPTAINTTNLRVMVANPQDLYRGEGAADSVGQTASLAVQRLRADQVKTLPESALVLKGVGAGNNAGDSGGNDAGSGAGGGQR